MVLKGNYHVNVISCAGIQKGAHHHPGRPYWHMR